MNSSKNIFYALLLCTVAAVVVTSCGDNKTDPTPPPTPTPTPTPKYDTIVVDTFYVDTLRIDTIVHDTVREVSNNRVVLSYTSCYYAANPNVNLTTHICYSCAALTMNNGRYVGFDFVNSNHERFRKTVALKEKKPELKILLSFGNFGNEFVVMSADSVMRRQFAEDCLKFCQDEGIDGIDLDWEFPGKCTGCDPAHDVDNYTAVFRTLREVMGNDYLITFAGAPKNKEKIEGGYRFVDLQAVEPYIDWINLMCYDYDQGDIRHCPHNALYGGMSDNGSNVYWDISRSYTSYKNAKFPMDKIVVGVAFYGRHSFDDGSGEMFYKEINDVYLKSFTNIYSYKYNNIWKVPTLYKNGEFWCSYDDPRSIAEKGKWLIGRGMRGIMHWQVAGDNARNDLQHACWDAMKKETVHDTTFVFTTDTVHYKDTIIVPIPEIKQPL